MVAQSEARRERELPPPPEGIRRANLQFKLESDRIPWIYASLMNTPQVELYNGDFPEPFTSLKYVVAQNQDQLILTVIIGLGDQFKQKYGTSIGSPEDLEPLLKRYPNHQLSGDNKLVVARDGQVQGVIARIDEDRILIKRGGQAGQLPLSQETPTNSLAVYIDQFNLLIQRYVSAIWKSFPEFDQRVMESVLEIPALPEGAPRTYFSTFEIVAKEFTGRSRPVDLDEEIGGYSRIKNQIRGLFMDMTNPELSRRFGTQPFSNRFILISGEEGTGKSLFPKALDAMLRAHFGDKFEHFRLPLGDMLTQYGPHTVSIVKTILDHIRENEKKGISTLLHLDNIEQLTPSYQRGIVGGVVMSPQMAMGPSGAEFSYNLQTLGPVVMALRDFGRDLGGESHHLIVYGESRIQRSELPEGVARTFRRTFTLNSPTVEDLADILRVQITTTKKFAGRTGQDPFIPNIESRIQRIAQRALGLKGRDVQQALLNIASTRKAEWDGSTYFPISDDDIIDELNALRVSEGMEHKPKGNWAFSPETVKSYEQ